MRKNAVHPDRCDSFGRSFRLRKRSTVGNKVGIQQYKIGGITFPHEAAVFEPKSRGWQTGHLVNRLLKGK
jgi:hypothetical protein